MTINNATVEEGGTLIVTATFKDTAGLAFTPKTLVYSVTDESGIAINGKSKVSVTPATSSFSFVIYGDDLAIDGIPNDVIRVLTIEGTYDSVYGNDLPFRNEGKFTVVNTVVNP